MVDHSQDMEILIILSMDKSRMEFLTPTLYTRASFLLVSLEDMDTCHRGPMVDTSNPDMDLEMDLDTCILGLPVDLDQKLLDRLEDQDKFLLVRVVNLDQEPLDKMENQKVQMGTSTLIHIAVSNTCYGNG